MKKKKETEPMDAMNGELEAKELPEELEAQDGNQTDGEEEDMLEDVDLFIPGDEEEEEGGPAGAPAGAEAGAEAVAQKAPEPVEVQGPPPPPAVQVARGRVPEAQPPKAYIRPRQDAGSLSYGSRAALYLSDKDEYRSMIGGNKQWK